MEESRTPNMVRKFIWGITWAATKVGARFVRRRLRRISRRGGYGFILLDQLGFDLERLEQERDPGSSGSREKLPEPSPPPRSRGHLTVVSDD